MARTQAQVQLQIQQTIAANNNLNYTDANNATWNITRNTSIRALWNLWTFIVSAAQVILEQLQDLYQIQIEAIVAASAAASQLWLQAKMFQFQYSVSNPQVLQLINGVPQYPVINPSLNIVTACSVFTDAANTVQVKFAVGNPLSAASAPQIAAAQSYLNQIGGAGIQYNATSLNPDLIFIMANIYYNGMYSSVIQNNVVTAINNWLTNLSQTNFDGKLLVTDLENLIRNITGVDDIEIYNLYIRRATDPAPSGGPVGKALVTATFSGGAFSNPQTVSRLYDPETITGTAGYIVAEPTTGWGMLDVNPITNLQNLNFISQ